MDRQAMKQCFKCRQVKPFTEFYKDKYTKDGYYPSCKEHKRPSQDKAVKAAYDKQYRKTLGLKKAANQFKVTVEFLENLLKSQNNLCAICNKPETSKHANGANMRLSVDHCHKTGKVRGFLCTFCNKALGLFKNDPKSLLNAHTYLNKL